MKSLRLPRRTVLRGLGIGGISLGLPLLDAMQDGGGRWYRSAEAAPIAPPLRFVLFLISNGTSAQSLAPWTPSGQGAGYTLSPALQPMAEMRDKVNVLTGLRHTAYFLSRGNLEHGKSCSSLLTGVGSVPGTAGGPTLDQSLAGAWASQTRIASVQAICDPTAPPLGDPMPISVSWADKGQPLPPIQTPALYFKRLFGAAPGAPKGPGGDPARDARYATSVLDYVKSDVESLKRVLGAQDQLRLSSHMASLRDLEKQMAPRAAGTTSPAPSACQSPTDPSGAAGEESVKAMVQLTALALACDVTRIATLMYSYPFGNAQYPWLKINSGDHGTSHGGDAGYLPNVRYKVQTFTSLLRQLDGVQEGGGTLLSNSIVLGTSDVGLGSHNTNQHGVLLAGTAGGQIKTGQHVLYTPGTPLNRLLLTIMQLLKMPTARFGTDGDQPLAGLT